MSQRNHGVTRRFVPSPRKRWITSIIRLEFHRLKQVLWMADNAGNPPYSPDPSLTDDRLEGFIKRGILKGKPGGFQAFRAHVRAGE